MNNLDARELMTMDYKLQSTEELESLKRSIMRSIQHAEAGVQLWHREYTSIRLELASRSLNEREREVLPTNTDLLEPEYVQWVNDGEAS